MRSLAFLYLFSLVGCATIHFRSHNSIPVTFTGDGKHQKEVLIEGERNFYWWGTKPEHHVVYVDEEVKKAGFKSLSKAIIYEQKNPQDILISFLTFGIYMPRGWTIMGFTDGQPGPLEAFHNEK